MPIPLLAGLLGGAGAAAPAAGVAGAMAPAAAAAPAAGGGPIPDLLGAAIGGLVAAAKKRQEGDVKEMQAQAAGAQNLGANQTSALGSLMQAYRGVF